MANPFESSGVWLCCALHAHTTNSDGELPPPSLVRHYEDEGFDVLAFTDHWVRTEETDETLVVIPGVELEARAGEAGREAHVLGLGITADPALPRGELPTLEETVAWVVANEGVAYLAHPYWSGLRMDEVEECQGLAGLEVFNGASELELGRGLSSVHWDEVLETGRPWLGIATDDTHHPGRDSGLAWTWVRTSERSAAGVVAALAEGTFYSSAGPRLEEVHVDGRTVEVRCRPVMQIRLLAGRERGASVTAGARSYLHGGEIVEQHEQGITAARLTIPATAPYARLEVRDWEGASAWTNPLWP